MPKLPPAQEVGASDIWEENSPQVRLIQHKYERIGLQTWNNSRVSQLARDLGVSIWVLCAWAGVFETVYDGERDLLRMRLDKKAIKKAWADGLWPTLMTVNFQRLEAYVKAQRTKTGGVMLGKIDVIGAGILSGKVAEYG